MVEFHKFQLQNGIRLIVQPNKDTAIASLNVLYDVGSKDEQPDKTGLAHLMEHLMFEGSVNIPNYDAVLQNAGGENNAFTNNDVTNYYLYLPAQNLELGFWLESDRLYQLALTEKKFLNQQKVVLEEFEETTLDIPYGDAWHHLRNLTYKKHPYRWPVIGLTREHVANFTYNDVINFYEKHYQPQHSIWVVAGPVNVDEVKAMAEKWLANLPNNTTYKRSLFNEPEQHEFRQKTIEGNLPSDALYMAFKMPGRNNKNYHACEILSDVLATGRSSRFEQNLVKKQRLFSSINAFVTSDLEQGMFVVEGMVNSGVSLSNAEASVWNELELLKTELVGEKELERIKNKIETTIAFSENNPLNTAINIAFYELMGNANEINEEIGKFRSLTSPQIKATANKLFQKNKCSTVRYKH